MATQYKKIYQRQADRSTLDSIIREKFLSFDTTNDYILYSKDGNNYIEFYNKSNVDSISATLNSRINLISSGTYLPLSGGTLSGQFNGTSISASGNISASSFIKKGGTSTQFLKADGSVDTNSYALNSSLYNYLPLFGGTMIGGINLSNVTSGFGLGISGTNGNNDGWTIRGGAFGADSGYLEIATRDNGNEPIYVRQYIDNFNTPFRTLTLLDGNGSSNFPGTLSASSYYTSGNSQIGGSLTVGNLSTGFVRSNSSGLLTSSPLVAGDIPSLSNLYLPLSGGTLTGNLTASSFVKSGGTSAQVLLANGSVIATSALGGSPVVSAFRKHDYQPTLTESNQMLHTVNCPANFWTNGYVEIRDTIQVKNLSTDSRSMGWGIYLNESADLFFKNEVDPATDTKYLIDLMINKVGTEASNTYLRCTGKIENITAGTVEYVDNIAYMNNTVFTAPTTISLDASTAYSTRIRLNLISGLGKTWY